MNLLYGFLLGALIGLVSWWLGALSLSGAFAATVTGGLIFGLGGLPWAVLLLIFFTSSSTLSKMFNQRKAAVTEKFSKGSRRDWGQVLANGGLGAVLVVLYSISGKDPIWYVAFAGAMAAVNADTWATELGVLSKKLPVLMTTRKPVERGTSGAVSTVGMLAAFGGSILVAFLGLLMVPLLDSVSFLSKPLSISFLLAVTISGVAGSLFDSFLGATLQTIYYCPQCQKETERHPVHLCGTETVYLRGWRWMDNDLVNFACSLVGSAAAVGIWLLLV
jgi:uncharacterized protein (TIGR00297 family)